MNKIVLIIVFFSNLFLSAQEIGVIKGRIVNLITKESIPFANVIVVGTNKGATSNEVGFFEIKNVPLGYNKIQASFIGFKTFLSDEYLVSNDNIPFIDIKLEGDNSQLKEVVVQRKLFFSSIISPTSMKSLGISEIEKNPGGDRDILKVLQSLPGVASNPGFRNDIIIRGGATSENKFYIDGIEIPVINHFQTQGATGGPVGIINTDLIRKVDFLTSSFPANRGNALSSVVEFTQKRGNKERIKGRGTLGTSDAGITFNGPIGRKTTYIFSARQSYLQFLFKVLKLPFLPTYNDFQFNCNTELSENSQLAIIGIGAVDNFKLNEEVNDGIVNSETLKKNKYILNNIPIQKQWNYTVGAKYDFFDGISTHHFIVSRNEWENTITKYLNNTNKVSDLLLNYKSKEIENKFRYENDYTSSLKYTYNVGVNIEQAIYTNTTFQKKASVKGNQLTDFSSVLKMFKYGVFSQVSKSYFKNRLGISIGLRLDGNTYNDNMENLLNQFSPRLGFGYDLNDRWAINTTLGVYYQLPSYTILGYRDNKNILVNKKDLKYIQSKHAVLGVNFNPNKSSKISLEAFYKKYSKYPFSVKDNISLANLGTDFGVIGNEQVVSSSKGRSYGIELSAQKKSYRGLYGILSYTFVKSEFENFKKKYISSTWDNRHLLTLTGGTKLRKNWEIGGKFRLVGGRPYTPYDYEASSLVANYDINNSGILDYTKLNTSRFKTYTQLDFRVDKTWFFKNISLNVYVDVQNVYAAKTEGQSYLLPKLDDDGNRIKNAKDNTKYELEEIENSSGRPLPRFGVIIDF